MYKKKPLLITFEGIEGSGKSFQSKKLYKNLKKKNISSIWTREPGGTINAERIRKLILDDYFGAKSTDKFDKYTDTLLYLAARNEHIINKIKPNILKKKVIICDRFIDSTFAYQVYGKEVKKNMVDSIHKYILRKINPNITFLLTVKIKKALQRINERKNKNRYDKFSKAFYVKAQKAFIKIAKKNKKRYVILDNSLDSSNNEKLILNKILNILKNDTL
tara:strand:- start:9558 stop:10214 length:657 start_codon:yes stop_codon:yes gene_type:complete